MTTFGKLLFGAALVPACIWAQTPADSAALSWDREMELNEVVVVARRPVVKQQEGKLVYLVKNDPYATGLDGLKVLDRVPRVAVSNGTVSVAGKGNVRYIIDGVLMELDASAMRMRLQDLRAENIEKIELLTTPPSRYAAEPNAAYISITTRDESLGTRGSVYGSLNQGHRLREYLSGSVSHTTRRVELSLDANLSNYYQRSDAESQYVFDDHTRQSATRTDTHLLGSGFNAIARFKLAEGMKAGAIANYSYEASAAEGANHTLDGPNASESQTKTTGKPNNAVTLTAFYDWTFGGKGEAMELTYNFFDRHSPARSDISTTYADGLGNSLVSQSGANDYRLHSGKADFRLPYAWANLEAGAAYTSILNTSDYTLLRTPARVRGEEVDAFCYTERVAAAYLTASRGLGAGLWAKLGLRYEYTWTRGASASVTDDCYGRLFPTANLSWTRSGVGTFNLSYSMGMGRPNLWELNPFRYYTTADEYASGNPALKPTVYNNAEVNFYGLGGLYAVLYTSFASDAIGYVRRVDGTMVSTMPYNCLSTNKTGLYANYKRTFFGRWEVTLGGEVFRTHSHSYMAEYTEPEASDWSGKLEASTSVMLNRAKTLIFSARFTHYFPWEQNGVSYDSFQLLNASLRYSLLQGRLTLSLTANDPFGWNKTRTTERYAGYTFRQTFNAHTAYVLVGVSWTFGRDKVKGVWRASKEVQSRRTK